MPLSTETLDNWFTYHPPTDETRPKYAALTKAQQAVRTFEDRPTPTHDEINSCLRQFVELIDVSAPDSADKTAAVRCVRIARNALNEAVVIGWTSDDGEALRELAANELLKARWQANSAIACGGK